MKYLSLFSGIGGFELGIGPEHGCEGYSEVEPNAIKIYEQHFKHRNFGDITRINAAELPDFDFLCGGFPCQSFSIAGKRGGFEDTRGTMFFHIARIIEAKKPKNILLENVKGLLSHDSGKTFEKILSTLDELGYDAEWCVLDSANYGAAPRPRIYIHAVYRDFTTSVLQRAKQATSLYTTFIEGLGPADERRKETGRGSGRIIRTFAKLPDWLDSWDSFYTTESAAG